MYPPKITEIEYNRFSPYTPIQYHNENFTKYAHHHIDLLNYLNDKGLNVKNNYYSSYHDASASDRDLERFLNWNNPFELGQENKKHH